MTLASVAASLSSLVAVAKKRSLGGASSVGGDSVGGRDTVGGLVLSDVVVGVEDGRASTVVSVL